MKHYLKKCDAAGRATEEIRLNMYCALGNEFSGASELPAIAFSPASFGCCEYHDSAETGRRRMRSPDLEGVDNWQSECFGTETSTSIGVKFSGEATSPVENWGDARQQLMGMEKPKLAPPATENPQRETPSAAELEEFFTEAEEYLQKRFAEKYNYDIVKDAPISGGRYQWVPTHI